MQRTNVRVFNSLAGRAVLLSAGIDVPIRSAATTAALDIATKVSTISSPLISTPAATLPILLTAALARLTALSLLPALATLPLLPRLAVLACLTILLAVALTTSGLAALQPEALQLTPELVHMVQRRSLRTLSGLTLAALSRCVARANALLCLLHLVTQRLQPLRNLRLGAVRLRIDTTPQPVSRALRAIQQVTLIHSTECIAQLG